MSAPAIRFSRRWRLILSALGGLAAGTCASQAWADLVLETETAQLGKQGEFNFSNALQSEQDHDGRALLTETQYEYGVNDRTEILIEPFFYERDTPKAGRATSGVGDVEVTGSYIAVTETASRPALVIAQKIKLPTASNDAIGSGKVDAQSYVIIGKTWGDVHLNANLGYEYIGKVHGDDLKDQGIYDLSLDLPIAERTTFFVEGFGNTAAAKGESGTQAAGAGLEYQFTRTVNGFVAAARDTDHVTTLRFGLNYGF